MSNVPVPPSVSITPVTPIAASQPNDVSYVSAEYVDALSGWRRVQAACAGQEEVKKLPNILPFLNPMDKSEDNKERNDDYKNRAVYFNATGRTREGLIGLAFAKNPEIEIGDFKYLLDNADGKGSSIYSSAQYSLGGVLTTGRQGLLVDIVNELPCIISYPAESIINWRFVQANNKKQLVLLVLLEIVQEADGDYGTKYFEQYREYRMTSNGAEIRIWRREAGKSGKADLFESPRLSKPHSSQPQWQEIPFTFVGSISNSPDVDPAPLRGLADMNLAHFQNSADFEDSVFLCGQPQAFMTGLDTEWRDNLEAKGVYLGSRKVMLLPVGATAGMLQADPNTLAKDAMEMKQAAMVALGARIVEENKVTKTATQAAGDIATGTSVLGLCCANVSEAYVRALQWCGVFKSNKPFLDAKFALTQDFSITRADAQTISAVVEAWQSGAIGTTDKNVYFRKAGLIETERTDEEIQQDIETTQEFLQPILNPAPPIDPNEIPAEDKLKLEKTKAEKPPPKPVAAKGPK